jgi:YHS domain-containing protein
MLPERVVRGVTILAFILRVVLWLALAVWLAVKSLRWLFGGRRQQRTAAAPAPPTGAEPRRLHRDPICGTYVSSEISHTLEVAGEILHFCSDGCREKYRRGGQRTASAS